MKNFKFLLIFLCFYIQITFVNCENNVHQYQCKVENVTCFLDNVNVTISTKKYQVIPNENVIEVKFRNSHVQVLTSAVCDALPNVDGFNANKVVLISIDEDAFQNCKNLITISLMKNYLSSLPEGLLKFNPNLNIFSLSNNKLQNIPESLFKHNPNLESVKLSHNQLASLPKNIFKNNKKIRGIHLQGNQLKNIQFIEGMPVQINLTRFVLNINHLIDINITLILYKFPNLKELWIDQNKFLCEDETKIIEVLKEKNIDIGYYEKKCTENIFEWKILKLSYIEQGFIEFSNIINHNEKNLDKTLDDNSINFALIIYGLISTFIIIGLIIYIIILKRRPNPTEQVEIPFDPDLVEIQQNIGRRTSTDSVHEYFNHEVVQALNGLEVMEKDTYDHLDFENQ